MYITPKTSTTLQVTAVRRDMDEDRSRLPANRNCYRLSRVSWAL